MSDRIFEYQDHWLVKRKDTPNYHIYWCKPGTRRVRRKSTNTADFERAKQELIELARKRALPTRIEPEDVLLLDALNDYVEITLAGRPSQAKYVTMLKHWLRFFEAQDLFTVAELTLDMQDLYVSTRRNELLKAGYRASNATIQTELAMMKAALRQYWRRGLLGNAPYVRSLTAPPSRSRFLTPTEAMALLRECHQPHLRLFVLVAMHTAQRPGAILSLQTDQVNLANGTIDFLRRGDSQSKKRKPVVPITATLRPELELAVSRSKSGYVVEFDGKPVKSVRTSFRKARDRAGLGPEVCPYTLRHTGATLMAANGVPLRQIAGMLGHSELTTTELYAKHSPDFLNQARDALDRVFGESY